MIGFSLKVAMSFRISSVNTYGKGNCSSCKCHKTMADKLMLLYTLKDDYQNNPFYRLKLVVETFGQSTQ